MTKRHLLSHRSMVAVGWLVAGLLACTESQPTSPSDPAILAARGGGGPSSPVKVNEAVPNEAPQDTTIWVRVIGS
ncbi:MAG TPA: hypothetical protein VK845_11870, partial [Gemmatimonadales bacterium]|nr:hypothetical protein [Gemmatimonadales bacterium]